MIGEKSFMRPRNNANQKKETQSIRWRLKKRSRLKVSAVLMMKRACKANLTKKSNNKEPSEWIYWNFVVHVRNQRSDMKLLLSWDTIPEEKPTATTARTFDKVKEMPLRSSTPITERVSSISHRGNTYLIMPYIWSNYPHL